jgi:hypothetical protein
MDWRPRRVAAPNRIGLRFAALASANKSIRGLPAPRGRARMNTFAPASVFRYLIPMPRADRISLTAGGLAMPPVDHLSNKGTLNFLLDRALSGIPAGLPPDRTMFGLFMNFSRLTDKALREYDAARAELLLYVSPHDGVLRITPYLRAIDHMENCVSAAHRAVLNAQALQANKIGRSAPRLTPRQEQRLASSGRAASLPDVLSVKILSHPWTVRSLTWLSSFWLRVDTRAYPIFAITRPLAARRPARTAGRGGAARADTSPR